jgi:glutamate dehydrogenase
VAFNKYVDSMLDVLLPNEEVRDYLKQEEILFFGPDENTADFMDWYASCAVAL